MRKSAAALALRHGLSTHIADGVAWLRLERPEAGNRITLELAQALCDAAAEIELDERVAVVVLAAGGASFCLGMEARSEWERRVDWVDAIGRLTRPVIAATALTLPSTCGSLPVKSTVTVWRVCPRPRNRSAG